MHGIVTLLDDQHYPMVESLWQELKVDCGLTGIFITPFPHFTWHIAAEYDFKQLEDTLKSLAGASQPFCVKTSGLGLFSGPSPVIYITLVKDSQLIAFHNRIWQEASRLAIGSSAHYDPQSWVPHITLAHGDVDAAKLGCAMAKLAFQPLQWEIQVDHLALVYQISGQVGKLQSRHPFAERPDGGEA